MTDLDAAFARIQSLALNRKLQGLVVSTHEGKPSLMVENATFCHLIDPATLVLACPIEQKALLMDISPDIYFETDQYLGSAAMLVRLDVIADEELALRLEDAWRLQAPERFA